MTQSAWTDGGAGVTIRWGRAPTAVGDVLVAASEAGVCRVAFGKGRDDLATLFPRADLVEGGEDFAPLMARVVAAIESPGGAADIPLDTGGTVFQQRVWQALRDIPAGETRSYGALAACLGQAGASRAVGRANGANRVAVLIPCHRVVRADGALGGYEYGPAIKRELLRREGLTF
ncbi:methylated-DNA--[protein]-cysteine S-methyltransferase [Croceicoccus sp. YJ47]|uniref:methylated-DNA--[protein]-cysteine S-methyltransferase n=1 Tax=Croceicoccus sp. YJ47 TaxID=2798724 RepID=UPI0019240C0B|nr:methylated-DNA--[protein]-cysteine S-methyltransferase [Croceicoccus sp. YJ47]